MDTQHATWDERSTKVLVNACIQQIYNKQRRGHMYTTDGWKIIVQTFNSSTGKQYQKKQLKNRLDILRKELKLWDSLTKETGVERDPATNNVVASDQWWKEHSQYSKFRKASLMFENELRFMFKDTMATGDEAFAPSFSQPQPNEEDDDNVYIPAMDEAEGSGDSEDDQFGVNPPAATGVTDEMATIGLANSFPSNTFTGGSGSQGKRKRGESSVRGKKQRRRPAELIADAVSKIAASTEQRTAKLDEIKCTKLDEIKCMTLAEVISELVKIPEVACDEDFRNRCIIMLQHDKDSREIFTGLKGNHDFLLSWLRRIVYSPPNM